MSDDANDGLDDILTRAFAHEYATLVDREFVDRVFHSIRLQSRIRLLILGTALAIGTIVCAGYVLPLIATIGTWLSPLTALTNDTLMALPEQTLLALPREMLPALAGESLRSLIPIGLLVLIAPCLFILIDDPI